MSAPPLGPSPAQIRLMGHNIAAEIAARRVRRRRHARIAIAAAGLAIGLVVTAAGIRVATAPADVQMTGYSCYQADDPRGISDSIGYPDDIEPPTAAERVDAAIEMCLIAFGHNGVHAPDPTVCELPDLRLGVFPNTFRVEDTELCRSLGLGPAPD